jgi:FKBP-type peptidyl-prolyl cis-trans isomerase
MGILLMAAGACSSLEVTVPEVEFEVIEDVTFDPSLGIDLNIMTRLPSGVYILDVAVGEGAELEAGAVGTRAEVDYQGWLVNGQLFDTGRIEFQVGLQDVIPGFEMGVVGMKVGGTRRMVIPPELAYGASTNVPPELRGAILIFEVDLVSLSSLHLG